jgi:hypothetical protein
VVLAVSQSKMEVEIGISLIIPTITALPTLVGLTLPASAAAATAAVTAAVARCAATACAAAVNAAAAPLPPLHGVGWGGAGIFAQRKGGCDSY